MVTQVELYNGETNKPLPQFVDDLANAARKRGFGIHNEDKMAMAHVFGDRGIAVGESFDLHMIQICKPEKAAKSLNKNPERAVFVPKFIMTFTKKGKTQIRFLSYSKELVAGLVDDKEFPQSLAKTFEEIEEIIEEAK